MNRTNELTSYSAKVNGVVAEEYDGYEAFEQFKEEYPGIEYNAGEDYFEYRGYKLDYFKSGYIVDLKGNGVVNGSYTLVSQNNGRVWPGSTYPCVFHNWLFSFGDKEERWKEFLEREKAFNKENLTEKPRGFWKRFLRFFNANY